MAEALRSCIEELRDHGDACDSLRPPARCGECPGCVAHSVIAEADVALAAYEAVAGDDVTPERLEQLATLLATSPKIADDGPSPNDPEPFV